MSNILLLLACLIIGILLRGRKILPDNAANVLNTFIVYVPLPALTLLHTVNVQFTADEALPILSAWLVFGASFLFFNGLKKGLGFDKLTVGALTVVAGISSISFVGFPIFELLYGAEGLKLGILMSQSGTFLVCSTVGIATVSVYAASGEKVMWRKILRDVFTFPPFAAFCIALFLRLVGYQHPSVISDVLSKIGSTLNVIALISIGLQMNFSSLNQQSKPLFWGLFFKLCLAPLIIFLVFVVLLRQHGTAVQISILGSALGSMNTIGIVAIRKGLNPNLVAQMIGISIPLSLVLLPFVYFLIKNL
ncbi:MAG: AEC family transporter [Saprospiraceae bacterium]|nr:AEC family transporter [Saprospiraceae bacterium]